MNAIRTSLATGLCALALTFSAAAHADLPPPDGCTMKDAACTNAGPAYDQPGVCQDAKCTRVTPDGPVTYDCLRCVASSGTGGASNTTGGASNTTGGSSSTGGNASSGSSGCDCAVDRLGAERSLAAMMVGLGLAALFVSRRRR